MNPWAQIQHSPPGRFRVGDRARLLYGFDGAEVEILEDHGPIGVGGRRFYIVRLKIEGSDDLVFPSREDEMELIVPEDGRAKHD